MPIKEILALSTIIVASIFLRHPTHFREAIRKSELQIFREVGRTSAWGRPSIFGSFEVRSWTEPHSNRRHMLQTPQAN